MWSRLNAAGKIIEICNSNNLLVYKYHLSIAFSISGISVNLAILFCTSFSKSSPLIHNYFLHIQMEYHSHILLTFSFTVFIYFLLLFFPSFRRAVGGGKRDARIGFFQNGKVEQVSFQYVWRKHDFAKIQDLPFLDFYWKVLIFFATMLQTNTMPSPELIWIDCMFC